MATGFRSRFFYLSSAVLFYVGIVGGGSNPFELNRLDFKYVCVPLRDGSYLTKDELSTTDINELVAAT